jgi:hypothetical protein
MKIILALVVILAAVGAGLLARYGTLSPCGMLRQTTREQATSQGGLAAFIGTVTSDTVIDGMLAVQYGTLTPGRCIGILINPPPPREVPPPLSPPASPPGN